MNKKAGQSPGVMTPSDSSHDEDVDLTKYSILQSNEKLGLENVTPDDCYRTGSGFHSIREFSLDANDSFQSPYMEQRLGSI